MVAGVDALIQSGNPAAVALLGHTPEQAVGRDVSMIVRPGREEALRAFFKYVRTGEKVRDVESSFVRRDGSLVDVRISVAPLADPTGEIVAFVAIFRDLSERNRQEAALRAKETSYQKLVETAHEGIWVVDVNNRATFVNQRMADLLGYTVEEMLGRSPNEFYFSDDGLKERDEHRTRSHEGIKESREVVYRRRDGEPLWAVVATTPILGEGKRLDGVLAMVTDITARVKAEENLRASERLFRSLFGESPAGQILSSSDRKIVAVNRAFCEMTGYTEAEILQNGWDSITPPDDQAGIFASFERLWSGELNATPMKRAYLRKDGSSLWGQVSVARVADDAGRSR